ncbi:MAG TPA: PIG-L family deacetylase [Streptosporangiaceae bacterium]|nr:PIG-L family deacetylase [Streptosporangiaceae bacterium]
MVRSLPLTAGSTIMILSPHLDDSVLSCGGLMTDAHRRGVRVIVITVFNGRPIPPVSAAAARFHARCGHTDNRAMDEREAEDDRALAVVGAQSKRLHLPEALYRRYPDGTAMYEADSAIFTGISPFDHTLDAVTKRIVERTDSVRPDLVLAPVGIGSHIDHLLVSAAAQQLDCIVLHYEDMPYVIYDHCRDWQRDFGVRTAYLHHCSDQAWSAKISAISCYESQLEVLWYSPGTWRKDLDDYAVAIGTGQRAERLWSFNEQ